MSSNEMIPEYYIDTSVLGGYFDAEFQEATQKFWADLIQGEWHAIFSTLTVEEVARGPSHVRALLEDLSNECYSILTVSSEAESLATAYIDQTVLGPGYRADALHVAVATLSTAKTIISWNFKHLVNLRRIEGFNDVNRQMGYRSIDIRTPLEVIEA